MSMATASDRELEGNLKTAKLTLRLSVSHRKQLDTVFIKPPLQFKSITQLVEWLAEGKLHQLYTERDYLKFISSQHEITNMKLKQQLQEANTQLKQATERIQKLEIDCETLKRKGARLKLMPLKPLAEITSNTTLQKRKDQILALALGREKRTWDSLSQTTGDLITNGMEEASDDSVQEGHRDAGPKRVKRAIDAEVAASGLERLLVKNTTLLENCVASNEELRNSVVYETLSKLQSNISAESIVRICDEGLSDALYHRIVQLVKHAMRLSAIDDSLCPLPLLSHKRSSRAQLNNEVGSLLGIQTNASSRLGCDSVRVDISKLLGALVSIYEIPNDQELHIKLQIDETPFYNDSKLERASIKVMNYALNRTLKAFKVQSENELFPICFAYVEKENAESLRHEFEWLREMISSPSLVLNGLVYQVQWHLACDLKATKALLGLKMGAKGDICHICTASYEQRYDFISQFPTRNHFPQAILPFTSERIHICTMHMEVRITERMIDCELQRIFTMAGGKIDSPVFQPVKDFFASVGINKHFEVEENAAGRSSIKALGFKDSQVRRIISRFRDFIVALNDPDQRRKLQSRACWAAWDTTSSLLRSLHLSDSERSHLLDSIEVFKSSFIERYGKENITHYLHILFAHSRDFLFKYGAPAIWNTQGMEKQHSKVKKDYCRLSQRGGNVSRSLVAVNELQQLMQISGRRVLYRLRDSESADATSSKHEETLNLNDLALISAGDTDSSANEGIVTIRYDRLISFFGLSPNVQHVRIVCHGHLTTKHSASGSAVCYKILFTQSLGQRVSMTKMAQNAMQACGWVVEAQ